MDSTTEDAYIPDGLNIDNHAHGKSQDESSSDQETETEDPCPTNIFVESSEQNFEKPAWQGLKEREKGKKRAREEK